MRRKIVAYQGMALFKHPMALEQRLYGGLKSILLYLFVWNQKRIDGAFTM